MGVFKEMGQRMGTAGELLQFFWQQKLWWMIPMVAVLLLLGLLIVFGSTTGVGPFVYTLF